MSLISCNSFVRSIFVGLNFNYFFYTILDCILVRVYCTENDPIYLILAEKFCFTIVNNYVLEINLSAELFNQKGTYKLDNFEWF